MSFIGTKSLLEREVCVITEICPMLLRIPEAVDDVHCNDCVLHRLINFRFQISRIEDIVLKNSN